MKGRPGVSYYVICGTGITSCHACMYSNAMEKTDLALCTFYEDERSTNSSTDWNRGQTVAFRSDFEPRYTFWSCNWFIGDAYLPYVVFTAKQHVFGLLVDYVIRHSSQSVLIFKKSNGHFTSTVITVPLLIGIERKTWLMSRFLNRGDWQQPPGLLLLTMLHPLMTSEPTNL